MRSSGTRPMPASDRPARRMAGAARLAVDPNLAAVDRQVAEDRPRKLRPPGADEPGEADDLAARAPRTRCRASSPRFVRFRTSSTASPIGAGSLRNRSLMSRPIIMPIRSRMSVSRDRLGRDEAAVAEHRDPVAEAEDLLHAVRDVDDAEPFGAEPPDHLERRFGLALGQRRGRLVEDDDPRRGRSARAMAMICRWATESDSTSRLGIEATPSRSRSAPASLFIDAWSIRPKRPIGWRPRKMFSATLR